MTHFSVGEVERIGVELLIVKINREIATLVKQREWCASTFAWGIEFLQRQLYAVEIKRIESWEMAKMLNQCRWCG